MNWSCCIGWFLFFEFEVRELILIVNQIFKAEVIFLLISDFVDLEKNEFTNINVLYGWAGVIVIMSSCFNLGLMNSGLVVINFYRLMYILKVVALICGQKIWHWINIMVCRSWYYLETFLRKLELETNSKLHLLLSTNVVNC